MIQRGEVDVVLAGGSEAPLLPVGFAALANMGALSKRNDDPTNVFFNMNGHTYVGLEHWTRLWQYYAQHK